MKSITRKGRKLDYERGIAYAVIMLASASHRHAEADRLESKLGGMGYDSESSKQFDDGIRDYLRMAANARKDYTPTLADIDWAAGILEEESQQLARSLKRGLWASTAALVAVALTMVFLFVTG